MSLVLQRGTQPAAPRALWCAHRAFSSPGSYLTAARARPGAWCGAVRCGAVRCGAARCGTARCGAAPSSALSRNIALSSPLVGPSGGPLVPRPRGCHAERAEHSGDRPVEPGRAPGRLAAIGPEAWAPIGRECVVGGEGGGPLRTPGAPSQGRGAGRNVWARMEWPANNKLEQ